MRRFGTGLGILLAVSMLFGGEGQNPGAVFLEIWPGARATALGGAFASTADDASATYYNMGGLPFIGGHYATLMHAPWLPGLYPGMYYEFGGYVHEFPGKGTLGVNAIYLTTGETEVIDENGTKHGTYTTFDFAPTVGYGFLVTPRLGVGIGAKFIYSFLVPQWVFDVMPDLGITKGGTGTTWAADAGVLYKPIDPLAIGVSIANLGPDISYTSSGEADPLPRTLRLGIRYTPVNTRLFRVSIAPEVSKILVGMFYDPDNTKTFGQKLGYEVNEAWKHLGIEACYYDFITARVGYFEDISGARGGITVSKDDYNTEHVSLWDFLFNKSKSGTVSKVGITYGGGLQFKGFAFDISFDDLIYDFPTTNMKLALSYKF